MDTKQAKPTPSLPRGCFGSIFLVVLVVVGIYLSLQFWNNNAIPAYIKHGGFSFNAWARDLNKVDFAFTEQGAVVWVHSYYRSSGKNSSTYYYQLDVIKPQPKSLIKKHYFTQTYSSSVGSDMASFVWTGKHFFIANQYFPLQFRSPATGEVVMDEKAFIAKFPDLKAGIGEIGKENDTHYIFTTKDGLKFHYFLTLDELLSEKEYNKRMENESYYLPIDAKRKDKKIQYAWGLSDKLRGEAYMVKQYETLYRPFDAHSFSTFTAKKAHLEEQKKRFEEEHKRITELADRVHNPTRREELLKALQEREAQTFNSNIREQNLVLHLPTPIFLNGEVIYGDSTLCVIKHSSEVGKEGKALLTALSKEGKVLWQKTDLRLFKGLKEVQAYNLKVYRKEGEIAVVSSFYERMGVSLLDITTGKVKWEYIPVED